MQTLSVSILLLLARLLFAFLIWFGIWSWVPEVSELAAVLLEDHLPLTLAYLALSAVGIEFVLVSVRNRIAFANVGSKSSAHHSLSRRGGR